MADVDLRIVDDAGHDAPAGAAGRAVGEGTVPHDRVLRGSRTAPPARSCDGWLHTGDVGVLDADGYLRITDRKKDMFICGGFNVYPAEVEGMMLHHPAAAQVAVVGIPDQRLGEVGHAVVVPRVGVEWDPDSFLGWCASPWPITRSRAPSAPSTPCPSTRAERS